MKIERISKPAFSIIGKEGSTAEGEGFIQRLWEDANSHFADVQPLAKTDEAGNLAGIWGAMSDLSRGFAPWEEGFTQGLYLAGIECQDDARPPEGWTKWTVPGYEYLAVESESPGTFAAGLQYIEENALSLAGAVHDFTDPKTGKNYQYFPIRKL